MSIKEKIKTREKLKAMSEAWKKEGKKVGFTSGSFDILHAGHADYLEKAKAECDILLVAVNSDISVKKYKGEDKPLVPEKERVTMIASLESVDYVYLFDERRNTKNIEELKPDFYFKAGDYDITNLASRDIVEKYGGKAMLIPVVFNSSSSNMIKKILKTYGHHEEIIEENQASHIPIKKMKKYRAIFLDRDGTINEEIYYLHEPEKFELRPNTIEGLKEMMAMGFKLAVITKQAGIGLGYYTKEDFYRVNKEMFRHLSPHKIIIDRVYFCPHSKGDKCGCRKPGTDLFKRAEKELNLDLKGSWMIGDRETDILAGKKIGCKTILIKSDIKTETEPDYCADDLLDAAKYILEHERKL